MIPKNTSISKVKKILYIGEPDTYRLWLNGDVPSHWFYGAVEMEQDGHEVVWAKETGGLFNDLKLILKSRPDMVFVPNLNIHYHLLLLVLSSIGLLRIPLYGYLHHEPPSHVRWVKRMIYRQLLHSVRHLFFLSELSMKNTVESGLVKSNRCSVPGWGPDLNFYSKIVKSDSGWYVSTGKENRDYDTLIEVFRATGLPLHICTSTSHGDMDYSGLQDKCRNIPNIKVTLVNNSPYNFRSMVREMASARALVCPLRKDRLNYCVGLSTITDGEGLGKPVIITENPYHAGRDIGLLKVRTVEDWILAVENIEHGAGGVCSDFSMASAYSNMKKVMGL